MNRFDLICAMDAAMVELGHNAPWHLRASTALDAIRAEGGAVVDRHELELLKSVYGFSLQDLTEPQE